MGLFRPKDTGASPEAGAVGDAVVADVAEPGAATEAVLTVVALGVGATATLPAPAAPPQAAANIINASPA